MGTYQNNEIYLCLRNMSDICPTLCANCQVTLPYTFLKKIWKSVWQFLILVSGRFCQYLILISDRFRNISTTLIYWKNIKELNIKIYDILQHLFSHLGFHCNDVIMGTMVFQITSLMIVYSTIYSDADQRKHQSSLAFVQGIQRWPVNSPHKWPVTQKMLNVSIWWHHHGDSEN